MEAGAGEPAVVLEAGLNNGAASWQRVMPLPAPHVRVAAYDRAGIGGSAPAPGLATINRQIDDLPRASSMSASSQLRGVRTTLLTVKPVASDATNGFRTALRRDATNRPHPA